jgi:hypothetical protein
MTHKYLTKIFGMALVLCSMQAHAQDYTVSPIPSQVYVASLPVSFTSDDFNSALIPLTFDFNFFGNISNSVTVSTNGYIGFSTIWANNFSPWQFSTTIPNSSFPVLNSFLGCYHDINNQDGLGTVTYGITGSAPYRKFVVIYDNNSQFQCNINAKTTFQMVLYETLNILDTQIIKKDLCATWNGGNAVVGVINLDGTIAYTPPGRNTGQWIADHEAWRFIPEMYLDHYDFTKCDDDTDGIVTFDLGVAQNGLSPDNPGIVTFHATEDDAWNQVNALSTTYTNTTSNLETIYANVGGGVYYIFLRVVDCNNDFDDDSVDTSNEDLNNDTNLANDDTDNDGIPNFVDNDDDGDLILTNEEYVFGRNANALLDTDSDGIPNYLDNDDDGDNILTINEDYNGNNNPADDDTNNDGTPDYLQIGVALGVNQNEVQAQTIGLYPNPASDVLNIDNKTGQSISEIEVYSVNGVLVKQIKNTQAAIPIGDLQSGLYFVKIQIGNEVRNFKFIKK